MRLIVTTHAERRIRQRLGLPRRAVRRTVRRARRRGTPRLDCRGALRSYLDELTDAGITAEAIVWSGSVWLFAHDGALLTVYPLPGRLRP